MTNDQAQEDPAAHSMELLLTKEGISLERLPKLQVAFQKHLGETFTTALGEISGVSAKFSVHQIAVEEIAKLSDAAPACALAAIYRASGSRILIGGDRPFVFTLVDILFGSDGSEPPYAADRGLTKIETRVAQFAFDHLAKALQSSLSSNAEVEFELERVDEKLNFGAIARKTDTALICTFKLRAFGAVGELFIVIPQFALRTFRDALLRRPNEDKTPQDPKWARQLKERVTQTEVTLRAIMEKHDVTLGDIARFEVGQVIRLPLSSTSLIKLESEKQPLFWCKLGQKDGLYMVRVEGSVDENQLFLDDVLGTLRDERRNEDLS